MRLNEERQQLVTQHLWLARAISRQRCLYPWLVAEYYSEACLALCLAALHWQGQGSFRGYAEMTLRRHLAGVTRKRLASRLCFGADVAVTDTRQDVPETIIQQLMLCADRLSPREWDVLWRQQTTGGSLAEVATMLGITTREATRCYHEAIRTLRRHRVEIVGEP